MAFKSSRRLIPSVRNRMDSIFGTRQYYQKVLSYGPIAYWPLWETEGAVAQCLVDPAQNGAYTGVMLGQPGIGDGNTSPFFDGANDDLDVFTVAFRAAFDGSEGTIAHWARVANAGVWTDGAARFLSFWWVDGSNYIQMWKGAAADSVNWRYVAGGVQENQGRAPTTDLVWMHLAMTWSAIADEVRFYFNGAQVGLTATVLGAWAGVLTQARIGAGFGGGTKWHGYLAHVPIFDRALTQPEIADLATV